MATTNIIGLRNSGMVSYDGAGVFAGRTLTAGSLKISISNGTGVSGNPTFDVSEANLNINNLGGGPLSIANGGSNASSFTTNSVIYYDGTKLNSVGAATNGQLVIGSTGSAPVVASLTAGTGVTVTPGAGSLTISAATGVPTSFVTDSGTATPSSNVLTVVGANGITTSGSGSTLTVNLTNPVTVPRGGTGQTSLTQNGVVYGNGSSAAGITAAGTNGQVLLAATGSAPAFATLTGSNGITFTTGANSLQISNTSIPNSALQNSSITINTTGIITGGGTVSLGGSLTLNANATNFPWISSSGPTQQMAINTGYIANSGSQVIFYLPQLASVGDIVRVAGKGAGLWQIQQYAGQTIRVGQSSTTVGVSGSITSLDIGDCVELLCITANTNWVQLSGAGTYTIV